MVFLRQGSVSLFKSRYALFQRCKRKEEEFLQIRDEMVPLVERRCEKERSRNPNLLTVIYLPSLVSSLLGVAKV
jgi:hypothetical protein